MNRTELVSAMAEKAGLSKKDTDAALKAFTGIVSEAMKNKDTIQLIGFGTFGATERAGRIGKNPITKEPMEIAPSLQPRFKASKSLKDIVNG